ncbi:hypothetical protein [Teredinibacter turnerae]|uniref:hypothetical protein n=1 Tax=Teredinibacter turnerae TaxID=2426 RepID=UPI000361EF69|nr:hypothetical protein [Teredinibacter turnerae]
MKYIEITTADGGKAIIDLDNPKKEIKLALQLQANARAFYHQFQNDPRIVEAATRIKSEYQIKENSLPETTIGFDEAADLYIERLRNHGRKGKKLAPRTVSGYEDKLSFWKEYFKDRPVHEILLRELGEIQDWMPRLPPNYKKRKTEDGKPITTGMAIQKAKSTGSSNRISEKTLADYLGQLKAVLEFRYSRGFTAAKMGLHIEIPNTKQSRSVERLPFSLDDLKLIFPGEQYGVDFGSVSCGIDKDCKFWFPLLAAYTGEIGQLKTKDIKTCPDTGII